MSGRTRALAYALIALLAAAVVACDEGGIGIGVSNYGGRWGGGTTGPGIVMGGGPVYP